MDKSCFYEIQSAKLGRIRACTQFVNMSSYSSQSFFLSPSFTSLVFISLLLFLLSPSLLSRLPASFTPSCLFPFPHSFLSCYPPTPPLHSPSLAYAWLSFPPSVSPRPEWWCVEVRQTDGGWGIAPASLWHWAPFRPGKWSMLNLILNTPSLTPADRRRVEASVWQHSWGNLIRPTVQVYLQVCLCACGCLCVLPSYLKQVTWHRSHLSCT